MTDLSLFWLGGLVGATAAFWFDHSPKNRLAAVFMFVFLFPYVVAYSVASAVRRITEFDYSRDRIVLGVLTPFGRIGVYVNCISEPPRLNQHTRVLATLGRVRLLWRPRD